MEKKETDEKLTWAPEEDAENTIKIPFENKKVGSTMTQTNHKKRKKLRNPFRKLIRKFNKLPQTTRMLISALAVLVVVLLVVLMIAIPSGNDKSTASATPVPTVSAEPTSTPKMVSEDGNPIGTIEITIDDVIKIHVEANLESGVLGVVETGQIYDVYEIVKDGSYTWYKIDEENWVPAEDDWVTYTENQ